MATPQDYELLRHDTGMNSDSLDDIAAAGVYAQVTAMYPTGSASVLYAGARVVVLQRRMAEYADKASYTQNQESESLSDVFKNLQALLDYWQKRLKEALAEDKATADGIRPPPSGTVRLHPVF